MLCPSPDASRSCRAERAPMAAWRAVMRSMMGTPVRMGGIPSSPVTIVIPDMVWPMGS